MIENFKEYTKILEEKEVNSFLKIKLNDHWKTWREMKVNFSASGYKFLGTIYCDVNHSGNFEEVFYSVFSERIKNVLHEYYDIKDKKYRDDFNVKIETDNAEEFNKVISNNNIEEVTSCVTKSNKTYYVFFNRKEKYFYFLYTNEIILDEKHYLNVWLSIKTKGEEKTYLELKKEVDDIKESIRKRKEEDNKYFEYKENVNKLKQDVEEHPENYEKITYEELPEEIKSDLKNKTPNKYIKYRKIVSSDPYTRYFNVYVNDKNFTKGYYYESESSFSRSGYVDD